MGCTYLIIPKKDGTVRFISDFWELNKRIKRNPYPIPQIQDMLLNLEGFQYATSLDLNMGYYHIELNPNSCRLCTIVLVLILLGHKVVVCGYVALTQGCCDCDVRF
jgi:hypothetical protein